MLTRRAASILSTHPTATLLRRRRKHGTVHVGSTFFFIFLVQNVKRYSRNVLALYSTTRLHKRHRSAGGPGNPHCWLNSFLFQVTSLLCYRSTAEYQQRTSEEMSVLSQLFVVKIYLERERFCKIRIHARLSEA